MKKTYNTLDALRGIAALAVVIFHAKRLLGWDAVPGGYLAVDFFFVLSGFVIAYAYDRRLGAQLSSKEFIWGRYVRFYPLYFAGFVAGLLYELGMIAIRHPQAVSVKTLVTASVASLLFLPFPFGQRGNNIFAFNVPSWSLFYELVVNAIYAVIFRFLTVRVLRIVSVVSGLIFGSGIVASGTGDIGALADQATLAIARTIFSFSVGVLIYRNGPNAVRFPLIGIFCLLIIPMLAPAGPVVNIIFVFIISPLVVMLGSSVEPQHVRLVRCFRFLGMISFPIYAMHRPVLSFAQFISKRTDISPVIMLVAVICMLVAVSPLIERFYDRPIRTVLGLVGKPKNRSAT